MKEMSGYVLVMYWRKYKEDTIDCRAPQWEDNIGNDDICNIYEYLNGSNLLYHKYSLVKKILGANDNDALY